MPARDFASNLQLIQQSESPEVLFSRLSTLDCPPRFLIRSVIVTCQSGVGHLLAAVNEPDFAINVEQKHSRLISASLTHRYGRNEKSTHKGSFFIVSLDFPNTFLLLTVSGWPFWSRALLPYVKKCYPSVVRVFLSQLELLKITRGIRESKESNAIRIRKISSCRRLVAKGARRRFETDIRWTDSPLESVFRKAIEENVWFKSVTFELGRGEGAQFEPIGAEASISKYGSFFCNSRFGGFLKTAILPMAELACEKMYFYMGRDRRSVPEKPPRPILISFPADVFRSPDDSRKFVFLMSKMNNASCSVLHGNPYVHISLVDNFDGSSARLWVLKPNELFIVPQLKTSEAALKRIVNHVFEQWAEGDVREAQG